MMMGDDKAKATVDAMMGGILSGVSKYSLEKSIASSVIEKKKDLIRQVRKIRGKTEWYYRDVNLTTCHGKGRSRGGERVGKENRGVIVQVYRANWLDGVTQETT